MTRALSISLLGSFSVLYNGKPNHALETPRLRLLISYLLLHRDTPVSRDSLSEALWPDLSPGEARSNLRKLLYRLTQGIPDCERHVEITHARIQWKVDTDLDLDVLELERICRAAPTREGFELASSLYRGELLAECEEPWIPAERERIRRLFGNYLEAGILKLEESRDFAAAIAWAQRLVALDPLNEKAYAKEMRLHALCGDKAAAMRTYRTCVTTLERELGEGCDPALTAEYERFRASGPGEPDVKATHHRLVGRHQEWRLLLENWKTVTSGAPTAKATLMLLSGEPGRGKTRLAEELIQTVKRQGFSTAFVRCRETGTELAFSTVAELLQSQSVTALPSVWLTELTRLLPELIETHPNLPAPRPMVEPWQQLRFYQAITKAFLLRQPLLLVIDDVQLCDAHSLKWLHHLFSANPSPQVLTVCTFRTGEEPSGDYLLTRLVPDLRRSGQLIALELPPLEPEYTIELATLEAGAALEPARAQALAQEAAGNPLFVLELIRGGHLYQTDAGPRTIPPTLQGMITRRLTRLSQAGLHVINLAAVAGSRFSLALLSHALRGEENALVEGLEEGVRRQFLRECEPRIYEFTHPRLHDIVYESLSSVRRGLLHRLLAEALMAMPPIHEVLNPQHIVQHLEKAGTPEDAVPYLLKAADSAWRTLDAEQAVSLYSRALELLSTLNRPDLSWQALMGREYVLSILGRTEQRGADQRALELLLQRAPDPARQAALMSRQAQLDALKGNLERAESRGKQALELARTAQNRRLELEVLLRLVDIVRRKGDFALGLHYATQAVECAHALGDRQEEIIALSVQGTSHANLHQVDRAIDVCEKAVVLAHATQDPRLQSIAMGSLASTMQRARRFPEAVSLFERAIDAARTLQDRALEQSHSGNLGNARFQLRQLRAALRAYDDVERLNTNLQDGIASIMLLYFRGGILGTLGRYAEVFEMMEDGIARATERGIPFDVIELSHRYSGFLNEVGQWGRAEGLARQGITLVEGLGLAPVPGLALRKSLLQRSLGVALLGQGQISEGMAVLEEVLASLDKSPAHRPHRLLTYAFMADVGLKSGGWERFVGPLEAHLPAEWSSLLRPEYVYLVCYRVFMAAGRRADALLHLQQGAALMRETVSQLETDDDILSYQMNVPPNRALWEALQAEGLSL